MVRVGVGVRVRVRDRVRPACERSSASSAAPCSSRGPLKAHGRA